MARNDLRKKFVDLTVSNIHEELMSVKKELWYPGENTHGWHECSLPDTAALFRLCLSLIAQEIRYSNIFHIHVGTVGRSRLGNGLARLASAVYAVHRLASAYS